MNQSHRLSRACPATMIPAGTAVQLPAGSEVMVMQALGGSVTVRAADGLYRIAGSDADAIEGYVPATAAAVATPAGEFSEGNVWEALRAVFDPEIPVNIVDLGLVYDLAIEPDGAGRNNIEIKMTLTAPGCGMGPVIAEDARQKVAALPGVAAAKVHIVWDPIWTPHMISEAGRRKLGLE
jgi:probable FeS assembly SUF system protein SufT